MTMGAFRSRDGKAPIFVFVGPGRWKFFLLPFCRAVFYQLKHLVFAVHAELLIDVRRMRLFVHVKARSSLRTASVCGSCAYCAAGILPLTYSV